VSATFRTSLTALRRVQKTSKGAPAYSRLVNRPLGRFFAAAAHVAGLTPNQVTCISALFTFSGIAVIALAEATSLVSLLVAVLLVLGYALDAADGQLARLRGGGSVAGEWLDHVVDSIKIACLHTSVLINWYRFEDASDRRLLLPIAFQVVATIMFFVMAGTLGCFVQSGSSSALYSLAVVPTDYGLMCIVLGLMWWSGFVWIYGLLLAANAGFMVLALVKWYREMRRY
jgi:phosphatidylglycerophosphate synthase